jgi:hypothetical protein
MRLLGILTLACALLPAASLDEERKAVRQASMDYIEALYNVQPELVERAVHPELAKRGFHKAKAGDPYREGKMSYEQLRDLAGRWNKDGKHVTPKSPKEVIILDMDDQTASVKIKAEWGFDYMHLAKYDGKWKIVNILWQSYSSK